VPHSSRVIHCRSSLAAAALGIIFAATHAYAQPVLVSTASDGTPGNGTARAITALDDSGRYVVFADSSTNLVTGDGNGSVDVFVKDRTSNATTRVSVVSDGSERTGDSGLTGVDASGDGQIVVFTSKAALVANDTNICGDPAGPCQDIYVHDRGTGQTTRVSVATGGTQANGPSDWPNISRNGRYVTFTSDATNLAASDTNGASDVFVHDRVTGTTTRVSVSSTGTQGGAGLHSFESRINEDGTIVAFLSSALLTDEPDPFRCVRGTCYRAFVHDRTAGTTVRVPLAVETLIQEAPPPAPPQRSVTLEEMRLDASGRWVALTVAETAPAYFGSKVVSLVYDRVAARTLVVDAVNRVSPGSPILAFSGDGTVVESNIYFYSRVGYSLVRLDRTTGFAIRSYSGQYPSEELSFTGDVATFVANGDVHARDFDSDDDQMRDEWETAFGLDPTVADGASDPDGDGLTNLQEHEAGTHPRGVFKRYLAEGAVNAFFTTRLAVVNPNAQPVAVSLRFLGTSGLQSSIVEVARPNERRTLVLTPLTNIPENDFSTLIESDQPVVVDRTMTWDATTYGGHAETALEAPATTWYLAEGATHGAFSLFYLLQNANDTDASVTVNYLRLAPETPVVKNYTVPKNSRLTIPVDSEAPELEATDVAARIDSNVPIIVERAMYSAAPGQPPFAAGHGGAGVPATALKWFLAEGATGGFFDLYVLVANPNPQESRLQVTYLFPSGEPLVKNYTAGPNNRLTISVDTEDPRLENTPVSVIVESTNSQPVVVERAMWWPSPNWYEAHLSAGTTSTGTKWALAEGENAFDGETYILIANTGATAGTATVTFLQEGTPYHGGPAPIQITVPLKANSRTNVRPADVPGLAVRFGTVVESDGVPIVVERAMYQTTNGVVWSVGTSAVATKLQ
jgi:hypothetical protein